MFRREGRLESAAECLGDDSIVKRDEDRAGREEWDGMEQGEESKRGNDRARRGDEEGLDHSQTSSRPRSTRFLLNHHRRPRTGVGSAPRPIGSSITTSITTISPRTGVHHRHIIPIIPRSVIHPAHAHESLGKIGKSGGIMSLLLLLVLLLRTSMFLMRMKMLVRECEVI